MTLGDKKKHKPYHNDIEHMDGSIELDSDYQNIDGDSSSDPDSVEEDYISKELIEDNFQRGIKNRGGLYLDSLFDYMTRKGDYELYGELDNIKNAFQAVKIDMHNRGNTGRYIQLASLQNYGVDLDLVRRIGYLAFECDRQSPSALSRSDNHSFNFQSSIGSEDSNGSSKYLPDFEETDDYVNIKKQHSYPYEEKKRSDDAIETSRGEKEEVMAGYGPPSPLRIYRARRAEEKVNGGTPTYRAMQMVSAAYDNSSNVENSAKQIRPHSTTSKPEEVSNSSRRVVEKALMKNKSSSVLASLDQQRNQSKTKEDFDDIRRRVASAGDNRRYKGNTNPSWITNKEWEIDRQIDKGAFGTVHRGFSSSTGAFFAVKKMNISREGIDDLLREISLIRSLNHENIVEYLGTYISKGDGQVFIFMELVNGGSVLNILKKYGAFKIALVQHYVRQLMSAVVYIHEIRIVHRDIKGGNILVTDNGTIKLADFGCSVNNSSLENTMPDQMKGTPYFMAPEVLEHSLYGSKGDVWAIGCTVIQMLTAEPPWKDRNPKGLIDLHNMIKHSTGVPYKGMLPLDAREFLEACFVRDKSERPSSRELSEFAFISRSRIADDYYDDTEDDYEIGQSVWKDKTPSLEDSGVMQQIKSEMEEAQHADFRSRSNSLQGPSKLPSTESTEADIERRMMARQKSNMPIGTNIGGGFGSRESPVADTDTPIDMKHMKGKVTESKNASSIKKISPRQNFSDSTPKSPQDLKISAKVRVPSENNPFASGKTPTSSKSTTPLINQSSNRDSEGLTPLPKDVDDDDDGDGDDDDYHNHRNDAYIAGVRPTSRNSKSGSANSSRNKLNSIGSVAESNVKYFSGDDQEIDIDSEDEESELQILPSDNLTTASSIRSSSKSFGTRLSYSASETQLPAFIGSHNSRQHRNLSQRNLHHENANFGLKQSENEKFGKINHRDASEQSKSRYWHCLKCRANNNINDIACINCATRKGGDGRTLKRYES